MLVSSGAGILMASAKFAGMGACGISAYMVYRGMPDKVMRRKLIHVFRMGGMSLTIAGYKGKQVKVFPVVPSIRMFANRMEALIKLPKGMDPKQVQEKEWLFRQMFGAGAELEQSEDAASYVLRVYSVSIQAYDYDQEEVAAAVHGMSLPVFVGKTHSETIAYNMVENPHLLIAGETGSGKSVALRSVITTLIRHCDDLDLYCADMKRSEFHIFRDVANEVVTEAHELLSIVLKLRKEMKNRGKQLDLAGVAHIDDLPEWDRPNYIVLAVDEVALLKKEPDIMQGIEEISTIGRALGVFLILSMQRPDSDVLDGKLKNNLTVRMAFRHADEINSRITLGSGEAAQIKNSQKGRMVFKLDGCRYVQGPFLDLDRAKVLLQDYKGLKSARNGADETIDLSQDEYEVFGVLDDE